MVHKDICQAKYQIGYFEPDTADGSSDGYEHTGWYPHSLITGQHSAEATLDFALDVLDSQAKPAASALL